MATVSSHILDSTNGKSARGIRVELYRLATDLSRQLIFDVVADDEGRILQSIEIQEQEKSAEYELVFHSAEYFGTDATKMISPVRSIAFRFVISDANRRYHMPLMLSPHSHSSWYSS